MAVRGGGVLRTEGLEVVLLDTMTSTETIRIKRWRGRGDNCVSLREGVYDSSPASVSDANDGCKRGAQNSVQNFTAVERSSVISPARACFSARYADKHLGKGDGNMRR